MITSVELWFRMRDVRNRSAQDYLPHEIKMMYDDIMVPFGRELIACAKKAGDLFL